jgi:hypothetical protein
VVVAPPGGAGATLLLARAATPEQEAFIGNQDLIEFAPEHPLAQR